MSDFPGLGGAAFRSVLERVGRGVSKVQERKPLPHDLLESDDAYLVVFDAPGVEQSDVQVRYLDGEVQVQVDRFREFYEDFEMRFPGRGLSLSGSASLPADAEVDPTAAEATLTAAGTLEVRVPRTESAAADAEAATGEGTTVDVETDE